jgi:hypothetical protein
MWKLFDTLNVEHLDRELAQVVAECGTGTFASFADGVRWARAHPGSALHSMLDWSPAVSDAEREAQFGRLLLIERDSDEHQITVVSVTLH